MQRGREQKEIREILLYLQPLGITDNRIHYSERYMLVVKNLTSTLGLLSFKVMKYNLQNKFLLRNVEGIIKLGRSLLTSKRQMLAIIIRMKASDDNVEGLLMTRSHHLNVLTHSDIIKSEQEGTGCMALDVKVISVTEPHLLGFLPKKAEVCSKQAYGAKSFLSAGGSRRQKNKFDATKKQKTQTHHLGSYIVK